MRFFIAVLAAVGLWGMWTPSLAAPAAPARFHIRFDTRPAEAILAAATADPGHAAAAADAALKEPGVQAMLAKSGGYDAKAGPEGFKAAVISLANGGSGAPFRLESARKAAPNIRALLNTLKQPTPAIEREVANRLEAFSPAGMRLDAKVVVVLGGTSDGYVLDDQPDTFYVDAGFFANDAEGFALVCSHELFHLVQKREQPFAAAWDPDAAGLSPEQRQRTATQALMLSLMNEGTAALVGDAMTWPGDKGPYVAWFKGKYQRNLARDSETFALFDTLLYRAAHDPEASFDLLYQLGFSGGWDSSAYFVGYRMAQAIDRYRGRAALQALLRRPPAEFILAYAALAAEHKGDPQVTPLAASTIETARRMSVAS